MLKTFSVPRPDGGCEVFRVLDRDLLNRWTPRRAAAYEKSILWLHPIEHLDFVRVAVIPHAKSRRGPLSSDGQALVLGYSKLTDDAPRQAKTGGYVRRLFFLWEDDFNLNMNEFPAGAIDPQSLRPGFAGRPPDVSLGGYLPRSRVG